MNSPQDRTAKLPIALKAVAGYFVLAGIVALLFALLRFVTTAGAANSNAYEAGRQLGAQARFATMYLLYVVVGIGLFLRRGWARKLGWFLLAANTFYGAYGFAYGLSHGRPSPGDLVLSFAVVGAWNGIWFVLLCRRNVAQTVL